MAKASTTRQKKASPEEFIKSLRGIKDSISSPAELAPALSKAAIPSVILLVGTQQVRMRRTIDWIRDELFQKSATACSSYFGHELLSAQTIRPIAGAITSPSLFSPMQLLVIYDADKVRAAAATPLGEALALSGQTAVVVLTCEKLNSRQPLLSRLPKDHLVVEFKDLSPSVLRKWIAKEVSLSGNSAGIESKAADMLIESYGSDVTALSREIHKLALLQKPTERIGPALVEELSLRSPEVTSFELMSRIAKKDVLSANELAQDLVAQGLHPLQLVSFLSRCIRTLLANYGRATASEESSGLSAELSNTWFIKNLSSAARQFKKTELSEAVELLKELDFRLKDNGIPHELALSIAVQRMSTRSFSANI